MKSSTIDKNLILKTNENKQPVSFHTYVATKKRYKKTGNSNRNGINKNEYDGISKTEKYHLGILKQLVTSEYPLLVLNSKANKLQTQFKFIKQFMQNIHKNYLKNASLTDLELPASMLENSTTLKTEVVSKMLKYLHPIGKSVRTPLYPIISNDILIRSILKAPKKLVGETFTEKVGIGAEFTFTHVAIYSTVYNNKVYLLLEDTAIKQKDPQVEKTTYLIPNGKPELIKQLQTIHTCGHLPLDYLDQQKVNFKYPDHLESVIAGNEKAKNIITNPNEFMHKFANNYPLSNYQTVCTEFQDTLISTIYYVKHRLNLEYTIVPYNKYNGLEFNLAKEANLTDSELQQEAHKLGGYYTLQTIMTAFNNNTNTEKRLPNELLAKWDKGRSLLYPSWYALPAVDGMFDVQSLHLLPQTQKVVQFNYDHGLVGVHRLPYYKPPTYLEKVEQSKVRRLQKQRDYEKELDKL